MKKTKYENEFFSITEKLCMSVTESSDYSIDETDYQLFENIDKLKAEIVENVTAMAGPDREFYLNRIHERLKRIIEGAFAIDEKTGETFPLGLRVKIGKKKLIVKPEEVQSYFSMVSRYKKEMVGFVNLLRLPQGENHKPTPTLPEIRPTFALDSVQTIYELLKDFFSSQHQQQLKELLTTGNEPSTPLLFLDNGNRLADAFKQLINADIITGVEKKELESWVQRNFCYKRQGKVQKYTTRYLNDIISTNWDKCKKPIITTKLDKATGRYFISKT